jgi:two-component system cell cycle response regulator
LLCIGANITGQDYPSEIVELLGIISNMLAVALHNSQIFDKIRELSYTDGMTGLHNYRFFMLRLKEELARARRNDTSVSQLIIDVDFFKNYNDTLGHPAGDEVLRQLSRILKSIVRDNDIVARYGGEEFAVILPATNQQGALSLGERIRKQVEKHRFPDEKIQPNNNLTISIGISTFPDDAVIVEDLVNTADQALYYAKNHGRNQVVSFSEIAKIIETE